MCIITRYSRTAAANNEQIKKIIWIFCYSKHKFKFIISRIITYKLFLPLLRSSLVFITFVVVHFLNALNLQYYNYWSWINAFEQIAFVLFCSHPHQKTINRMRRRWKKYCELEPFFSVTTNKVCLYSKKRNALHIFSTFSSFNQCEQWKQHRFTFAALPMCINWNTKKRSSWSWSK